MAPTIQTGDWLGTPVGRRCLSNEQRLVRQALDRVFGEQFVQIGKWGERDAFVRHARTRRQALVGWNEDDREVDMVSDIEHLSISTDSVDAVFLPHTLELASSPHALLRESERILRPDGHLIALGFVPGGPWGLRHLLSRDGYPEGHRRMIRERRLRDWLELLGFEVGPAVAYCHTLPFERLRRLGAFPRERWAQRWAPFLAGGYLLVAQKRVRILTPIRAKWRRPPRLRAVGGLVEPTTRASRTRESV